MAFCPNCGANLPDGSAFCTNCGARLARAAAPAAAPAARPAYAGAPAPARPAKKRHTGLILGIVIALLVVGIVLGVLFLTGVLGGSKGLTGTWTLVSSSNSDLQPGQVKASLDKDGKGYLSSTQTYQYYYGESDVTYTYYAPVIWTDSVLLVDGEAATYTRDKDTITVMFDGDMLIFNRTDKSPEKRTALKPGNYSLVRAMNGTQDVTSYFGGTFMLLINDGGTGTFTSGSGVEALTWDQYFITVDGDGVFYTYDGTNLTLYAGTRVITLVAIG